MNIGPTSGRVVTKESESRRILHHKFTERLEIKSNINFQYSLKLRKSIPRCREDENLKINGRMMKIPSHPANSNFRAFDKILQ